MAAREHHSRQHERNMRQHDRPHTSSTSTIERITAHIVSSTQTARSTAWPFARITAQNIVSGTQTERTQSLSVCTHNSSKQASAYIVNISFSCSSSHTFSSLRITDQNSSQTASLVAFEQKLQCHVTFIESQSDITCRTCDKIHVSVHSPLTEHGMH